MDERFRRMLEEAERIRASCRRTQNAGLHAGHMAKMIRYGKERDLFHGDVMRGNASDEYLYQSAESAALIMEVFHGQNVGSIFSLSRSEMHDLIQAAYDKAQTDIEEARDMGIDPEQMFGGFDEQ